MVDFGRFVAARLAAAVVTLVMVSFVVFGLTELSPVEYSERCWTFKPLEAPFLTRWVRWLTAVFLHGDFGETCILRMSINDLLGTRFWVSLGICISSLLLAYLIAIPVDIYSATANHRALNNVLRLFSYLFLLTASIIAVNLLTDVLLAALDPRFREGVMGKT